MQLTVWSLPSLAAVLLTVQAAADILRRSPVAGAPALLGVCACVLVWSLGQLLGTLGTDLTWKIVTSKLQYPAVGMLGVAWLAFALTYIRRPARLGWRALGVLAVIPAITIVLAWTNELHGAIWRELALVETGGFVGLGIDYGPWFRVHVAYTYALIAAGTLLLVYELMASPRHRSALAAVILAPLVVALLNVTYLSGWSPLPFLDPTPLGFAIGAVILARGVLHSGLLDLSPALHRQVLEQLHDGVVVLDAEGRIIDVNVSALAMLLPEDGADAALGVPVDSLLPEQALSRLTTNPERVVQIDVDLKRYEVRATRLDDDHSAASATVLVFRDVTRRLEAEAELLRAKREMERLAFSDPLTGLHNRRSFMDRLKQECDRVRRFDQRLSIVLLDLDRFRDINDTYGHEAGDRVLRQVAEDIGRCSRTCDVAGRLGGGEFALLLPGTETEGAMRLAERLRAAVSRHRPAADAEPVTISVGIAAMDRAAPDWQALLREADKALHASKEAGRDTAQATDV